MSFNKSYIDQMKVMGALPHELRLEQENAQLKAELHNAKFDTLHARATLAITTEQRDLWLRMLDECLIESEQLKDRLAESDRAYYDAAGTIAQLKAELAQATLREALLREQP